MYVIFDTHKGELIRDRAGQPLTFATHDAARGHQLPATDEWPSHVQVIEVRDVGPLGDFLRDGTAFRGR